ncbi:MAG: F0F1 ATP synthase subunit beta, partial [Gammaproteobacteria bacterium]
MNQDRIGIIDRVDGPVVDVSCEHMPPLHDALYTFGEDGERYVFEVYRDLDETHLRAIALHGTGGLRRGMPVYANGGPLTVPVSRDCLGRVLDAFGAPL